MDQISTDKGCEKNGKIISGGENPLCPEMGGSKTTVREPRENAGQRRSRTRVSFRVLLSRDFSRLSHIEILITASNRVTSINLVPRAFP